MTIIKVQEENLRGTNDATDYVNISREVAKLKTDFYGMINDYRTNHKNGSILKQTSTDSTQDFSASHYSKDSSRDDMVTNMSVEYITDLNNIGFEGRDSSEDIDEIEWKDRSHVARDMGNIDTLMEVKDRVYLQKQRQTIEQVQKEKEALDETKSIASSSKSSPYGNWAEKRKEACERKRTQMMTRELKMQARIEKRRNQLKEKVKEEAKHLDSILAAKEKEALDETKSIASSSTSSPYGNWAEKRKEACERKRTQMMGKEKSMISRELRMEARLEKHRDRVKKEVHLSVNPLHRMSSVDKE
jgi:type IV secretory pathway TrbF-like protein